jgi:hypothetical protein
VPVNVTPVTAGAVVSTAGCSAAAGPRETPAGRPSAERKTAVRSPVAGSAGICSTPVAPETSFCATGAVTPDCTTEICIPETNGCPCGSAPLNARNPLAPDTL